MGERGLGVGAGFGVDGVAGRRPVGRRHVDGLLSFGGLGRGGDGVPEAGVVEVVLLKGDCDRLLLRRLQPIVGHGSVQHFREHFSGSGQVCARQSLADTDDVIGTDQALQMLEAFEGGAGAVAGEEEGHFLVEGVDGGQFNRTASGGHHAGFPGSGYHQEILAVGR